MEGECKICNCTDLDCIECIEKTGTPCFWIDEDKDVCSACMYRNHAMIILMNLANASGAEFENQKMAVDILEHSIKKIIEATLNTTSDIELIKKMLK